MKVETKTESAAAWARTCPTCSKTFGALKSLRMHRNDVFPCTGSRPPASSPTTRQIAKPCPKCGKMFANRQGLQVHLANVAPCGQGKQQKSQQREMNACSKGWMTFASEQLLCEHQDIEPPCYQELKQQSNEKTMGFACSKCERTFSTEMDLRAHLSEFHPPGEETEQRSDQSQQAPVGAVEEDAESRTCLKCGRMFATAHGLHIHAGRMAQCEQKPTQPKKTTVVTCSECSKAFPTTIGLNIHMARVHSDEAKKAQSREKQLRVRTCSKCGKVFTSPLGLRVHMVRLIPCDQEHTRKNAQQTTHTGKKKADVKTCHKCGKTMATTQSLRMHLARVIPCDQVKPEPHNEEDRKEKAKHNTRKAHYKTRGRLFEIGQCAASHSIEDQDEAMATPVESVSQHNGKRHAVDKLSELGHFRDGGKRQRSDAESSFAAPPPLSPSRNTIVECTADGDAPTSQAGATCCANGEHGGDLLGSGCGCGACVHRWAKKLMNRMQQLEEEMAKLRHHVSSCHPCLVASTSTCKVQGPTSSTRHSSDQGVTPQPEHFANKPCSSALTARATPSAAKNDAIESTGVENQKAHGREDNITVPPAMVQRDEVVLSADVKVDGEKASSAVGSQLRTEQRRSKAPRPELTEDLVKMRLVEAYNHLNEQILVNERAVKDSLEFAESMMATDKTMGMELRGQIEELRGQIEELRVSIGREKEKRDVALAALISYDWGARRKEEELELLVNSATRPDMPGAQQTFHEKCAFLASEMKRNGEEFLALRYEMQPSETKAAADAQWSAKKLDDAQATRARLENELQEVYMCLLRSSRRLRSLVKVRSKQPRDS